MQIIIVFIFKVPWIGIYKIMYKLYLHGHYFFKFLQSYKSVINESLEYTSRKLLTMEIVKYTTNTGIVENIVLLGWIIKLSLDRSSRPDFL